jgi:hypothetical protein
VVPDWLTWDALGVIADWFTGVTAAVALFFAARAGKAARETNRSQQQTLELQRQQIERAQASKVSFHMSEMRLDPHPTPDGGTAVDMGPMTAYVVNASDSPVYFLTLLRAGPGPNKQILHESDSLFPTGPEPEAWELGRNVLEVQFYELYFQDAAGLAWTRQAMGELRRPTHEELRDRIQLIAQPGHTE